MELKELHRADFTNGQKVTKKELARMKADTIASLQGGSEFFSSATGNAMVLGWKNPEYVESAFTIIEITNGYKKTEYL